MTGGVLLLWLVGAATSPPDAARIAQVLDAAVAQTRESVRYDPAYRRIAYPGGDVPRNTGVCTDVVVRAYRTVGVDLQERVHEDMARAFDAYPHLWGLTKPDANIDHRRVQNLQTYFRRHGAAVQVSRDPAEYLAGDIVSWILPGNLPHIGIVTDRRAAGGTRPLIVHNIGNGPEIGDILFDYPISGHYRYHGQ